MEKANYTSADFPLYIARGTLAQYPDYSAACHWHEDLEFLYILSGHMAYSVNGTVLILTTGEGVFVNSRQLHYGFSDDGTDCHNFT